MDRPLALQPPPTPDALAIYAVARADLATATDEDAVQRFAGHLAHLTGCDLVIVYERYERAPIGDQCLTLAGQSGLPAERPAPFLVRTNPAAADIDRGPDPALTTRLDDEGMRARLILPVRSDAVFLGEAIFCSRQWDTFHPDVRALLVATTFELGHALARRGARASTTAVSAEAQASQKRQQFIAVLAHELRNPIAPIRSGLDLIAGGKLGAAEQGSTLTMMQRQLDHLVRLIDDLLDTARLDSGRLQVKREPVVLKDVVRSAIESIRPALFAKHQALSLDDDQSEVVLDADPVRLSQAFVNVLSANVKQTPEGGVIAISVMAGPDSVRVTFDDEDPSVDPTQLSNVFELFPLEAERHSENGLGIGLALVRGLVELNDGTVGVSKREGRPGASYVVSLPLPQVELEALRAVANVPSHSWDSCRMLVVDDNLDAASTLGLLLELDGATVRLAYDGPSAVAEAAEFQPEVILLDLGLPGFGGNEVTRRIRAANPPVRPIIVALTGWGAQRDRDETHAAGFDLHLVKPVDHDSLRSEICNLRTPQQRHGRN